MGLGNRVSTGLGGFDAVIDLLRLGDNVVWQVNSIDDYRQVARPYARRALQDGRRLIYVRFARHEPVLDEDLATATICFNASVGFEGFATEIHNLIEREGPGVFYVFDCLTDLLEFWYSDLMIGNFFRLTCPFLFQLETVAYFALTRHVHTYGTIARIRETTQVLLDLHCPGTAPGRRPGLFPDDQLPAEPFAATPSPVPDLTADEALGGDLYIHPLKVWERYSPSMFFPHLIRGEQAVSVTASTEAAAIFSAGAWDREPLDYWEIMLAKAREALEQDRAGQDRYRDLLIGLMLSRERRMAELCRKYLSLKDILEVAQREIGTGMIGGKSVGMLLARKILETEAGELIGPHWSPHDSFYLGADVFYTYVVQNGWWDLRMKQKSPEGYFSLAPRFQENLLNGKFPQGLRERFMRLLEYFGQFPIIVRSSSLLEDNYGNAFAGKYESVFCANQGRPEDRYLAFERAVRTVYASTMNPDALVYRQNRGLMDSDEQMAILVQRVSGDHHGHWFFPHLAGVGNSSNLYVWDRGMDPEAGMLRLVFGLGTRAVDRTGRDYARLVALDAPAKLPPTTLGDEKKFSQHQVDLIHLDENRLTEVPMETLAEIDLKTDRELFFSLDEEVLRRYRESGRRFDRTPYILNFKKLLAQTDFPAFARNLLSNLAKIYEYPVDIEFTVNFRPDGDYYFNLLQCRPLQTRGLGPAVELPAPPDEQIFFSTVGNFMGGNTHLSFDYVLFIKAKEYLSLKFQDQYAVARLVGALNQSLKGHSLLLIGPGRWGTSTPSLGVPVHFTEIGHMAAVCEYSYQEGEARPDLSFGSHFFQDVVESGLFYAAIFSDSEEVVFRPEMFLEQPNLLSRFAAGSENLAQAVHLAEGAGLTLFADVPTQKLICCR